MLFYFILTIKSSKCFPYSRTLDLVCYFSECYGKATKHEKEEITNNVKVVIKLIEEDFRSLFERDFINFRTFYKNIDLMYQSFGYFYSNLIKILKFRFKLKEKLPMICSHDSLIGAIYVILNEFERHNPTEVLEKVLENLDKKTEKLKFSNKLRDSITFRKEFKFN
ncbi:hypothetical protein H312_00155 [Anncaliia algerae PRA339]|uniref:Uncharacterized protein n=1 Tax=Anncaliia algerae PRA339 TaxID=1288291 RepID=A0A059F5V4_9MICR|nr:hypothetical protein H312_00155 [Anncaliia algerae PRA339]